MLISIEKAAEILKKGDHTLVLTTDGKVALVPHAKAELHMSSMDAINLMFYVIRPSDPEDDVETIQAKISAILSKAEQEKARQQKYREIRGGS